MNFSNPYGDCLNLTSTDNTVTIARSACGTNLSITGNNLDNVFKIKDSACISFNKEFINGVLTFTPVLTPECLNPNITDFTVQNLNSILNISNSDCITFTKSIVAGVLTFVPTLDIACIQAALTIPTQSIYTVSNGLNESPAKNFRLGGTLTGDTTVGLAGKVLSLLDTTTSTGLTITPSTNINSFVGDITADKTLSVVGNTYIGGTPAIPLSSSPRLLVTKTGNLASNTPIECATYNLLGISTATPMGVSSAICGSFNILMWNPNSAQTVNPNKPVCGSFSYLQFDGSSTTSGGFMSASAARLNFASTANVDVAIAYRACCPIPYSGGYAGTVNEVVGIQIDDQLPLMGGNIGTSYGIKQLGDSDRNLFTGPFVIPSGNVTMGTSILIAGNAIVPSSFAKTGSIIFTSRDNISGTPGTITASSSSIVDGISFTINSTSGTDTSSVNWWIINRS